MLVIILLLVAYPPKLLKRGENVNYSIFVHDHRFVRCNNVFYSKGGLPNDVIQRYVSYYGKLIIFARISEEKSISNMYSKIDDNVKIIDYRYVKKKELKNIIDDAKFVILRMPSIAGNRIYSLTKDKNKIIIEVVACVWDALWNHGIKGKCAAPYMFFKTRKIVKKSKRVIYVTNVFLQKRYPTKGYNIGCSDVSIDNMDDRVLANRIDKIRKRNNKIIIGTCAAVNVKYKGQEYVIKAISKLKKNGYDNIEYQLVGAGSPRRLQQIAKNYNVLDNIMFLGSLPHSEVFTWMDNIDVYIQPSNQEGLCRALVEAMSRGLPCLASNAGGNTELLNISYIFRKRKIKEICDKFVVILKNMEQQAIYNFTNAKNYEKNKLNKKRKDFYSMVGE